MNSPHDKQMEISDWLIGSALLERPLADTIISFGKKLLHAGLPVHRINCSTFQRHQIMGAVDSTWEIDSGECETEFVPKSVIVQPDIVERPAGAMSRGTSIFERYNLELPESRAKFPILNKLHQRGYTDYFIVKQTYGRQLGWLDATTDSEGVYGSFSTKQSGGFSDAQIETINSLFRPFSLYLKTTTEQMLSAKLLEAYVGKLPALNILGGMTERGDGNTINCALWYSDLRGSTRLSANLPTNEYLELLNNYFDCTAGSVIEHGGEVLKLIGDAVMAIFPFDDGGESQACLAALSAAREALSRIEKLQKQNGITATTNFQFGIGLHVGEVILGNVGTTERLDMTVTGTAPNQVTRVEALTKSLSLSVLASPQFFDLHQEGFTSVGRYPVPDLGGMTEIYCLVDR